MRGTAACTMAGVRISRAAAVCAMSLVVAACSGSPSSPSDAASAGRMLTGRTVSAVDGTPAAGLSVHVGQAAAVTSDSVGDFDTTISAPGTYATTIKGAAFQPRQTAVQGPAVERV